MLGLARPTPCRNKLDAHLKRKKAPSCAIDFTETCFSLLASPSPWQEQPAAATTHPTPPAPEAREEVLKAATPMPLSAQKHPTKPRRPTAPSRRPMPRSSRA